LASLIARAAAAAIALSQQRRAKATLHSDVRIRIFSFA
jgi:hypothetical protein